MPQKFENLKNKKLKESSKKWLSRQINDHFVEKAKVAGWRSRASFKIIEIDQKFKLFKKNKVVLDLGAAPGGWSQYAVQKVGEGRVLAIDLLEMTPISGVSFMQQDFLTPDAAQIIRLELEKIPYNKHGLCNIVLSDMAANTTGVQKVDHLKIINLLEEALTLSKQILKEGGSFVGKIFQGGSSDQILKDLRVNFKEVRYFKPESSRKDSSEIYLVAIGFRSNNPTKVHLLRG